MIHSTTIMVSTRSNTNIPPHGSRAVATLTLRQVAGLSLVPTTVTVMEAFTVEPIALLSNITMHGAVIASSMSSVRPLNPEVMPVIMSPLPSVHKRPLVSTSKVVGIQLKRCSDSLALDARCSCAIAVGRACVPFAVGASPINASLRLMAPTRLAARALGSWRIVRRVVPNIISWTDTSATASRVAVREGVPIC